MLLTSQSQIQDLAAKFPQQIPDLAMRVLSLTRFGLRYTQTSAKMISWQRPGESGKHSQSSQQATRAN